MIDRLLVGNITHLTDARYYAARGVYALAYRCDKSDPERLSQIKEMIDWVEGPKSFLDLRHHTTEPYPALADYDGFIGDQQIGDEDFEKVRINIAQGSRISVLEELDNNVDAIKYPTYVRLNTGNIDELIRVAEKNENIRFYLDGGEEEDVGLKDYDELNDLLDKLQWGE